MTHKTLMTTVAALTLTATTAIAANDVADAETLDRQNPQPADSAVEGATQYEDGVAIDTEAGLQNAETLDRQNPQAVDPVNFDYAGLNEETVATYKAVAAATGSEVMFSDGEVQGVISGFDVDEIGKSEIVVDISETMKVKGDELVINTSPENITIDNGQITIATTTDELAVLAGGDRGASDTRAVVVLN